MEIFTEGMDIGELPEHERKLILAYRSRPETHCDVDRILNLNSDTEVGAGRSAKTVKKTGKS